MVKNLNNPLFWYGFFLTLWIPYLFFIYQWIQSGNVFYHMFWWIFLLPALFDPYFYLVLFGIALFGATQMASESVSKMLG